MPSELAATWGQGITHTHGLKLYPIRIRSTPDQHLAQVSHSSIRRVSTTAPRGSPDTMRACTLSSTIVFLLVLSTTSVLGWKECPTDISNPIQATLDNGGLFSTCALKDVGVRIDVDSLFDVLHFSERDFLIFCRSSGCIKPVKKLLHSIPTNCLITYRGSARNMSEEVSMLYRECTQVVGAADKTDEDYVYRYFLD